MKKSEELTFKPKLVSKNSQYIGDTSRMGAAPPEDHLIHYGKFINEKHNRLRMEIEAEQ